MRTTAPGVERGAVPRLVVRRGTTPRDPSTPLHVDSQYGPGVWSAHAPWSHPAERVDGPPSCVIHFERVRWEREAWSRMPGTSPFRRGFSLLCLEHTPGLACGQGRFSRKQKRLRGSARTPRIKRLEDSPPTTGRPLRSSAMTFPADPSHPKSVQDIYASNGRLRLWRHRGGVSSRWR
jgi:hypothetical protein